MYEFLVAIAGNDIPELVVVHEVVDVKADVLPLLIDVEVTLHVYS